MSQRARPSAGLFHFVSPITARWVDRVRRDDFAGFEVDDRDTVFVNQCHDPFSSMLNANTEMVHSSCMAEAYFPVFSNVVVAEAVVTFAPRDGKRFGSCAIGSSGGLSVVAAMRSLLVVVIAESIKLMLQFNNCRRCRLRGEPSFQRLVEAFNFSLGLWVIR